MLSLQSLLLFCLSLLDLIHFVYSATSMELIEIRQQKGVKECVDGWLHHINFKCSYPGQKEPCLKDPTDKTKTKEGQIHEFAEHCCTNGRACEFRMIERFCCRTRDCTHECYESIRRHRPIYAASLARRHRLGFPKRISEDDVIII